MGFSSAANAGVHPGDPIRLLGSTASQRDTSTFLQMNSTSHFRLSPQVFEMEVSNLQWTKLGTVDSADSTLWYANCTTRTVENRAFGVKGGSTISILIFKLLSAVPTDLYMSEYNSGKFE